MDSLFHTSKVSFKTLLELRKVTHFRPTFCGWSGSLFFANIHHIKGCGCVSVNSIPLTCVRKPPQKHEKNKIPKKIPETMYAKIRHERNGLRPHYISLRPLGSDLLPIPGGIQPIDMKWRFGTVTSINDSPWQVIRVARGKTNLA